MDNDRKADLFRAVRDDKENEVRTLIETGRAIVNAKDNDGRTPLFYAMRTKSPKLIHYLLDRNASMYSVDNCKISILSFFIDKCMVDKNDLPFQLERINILIQRGMNRKKIFETIISVIFCKYFLLLTSKTDFETFNKVLELANTYADERDKQTVGNISKRVSKTINTDRTSHGSVIPEILDLLFGLGADPNSADSDGNTALHYAACLPFYRISEETTIEVLNKLENLGVMLDAKNNKKETPLLYCLSLARDSQVMTRQDERHRSNAVKTQVEVWNFLVKRSSIMKVTTRGESFFHLILDLFQQLFKYPDITDVLNKEINEKRLFSNVRIAKDVFAVNKKGLSPLHLWASLEPVQGYFGTVKDRSQAFLRILETILNCFINLHVNLDDRNISDQTPLHLCRTWTAVQLLLDAGANPNVVDSSGCTPLLVAAKNKTFLQRPEYFYPDVLQEPKAFWKTVLERGLDPFKVDKSGDSILCILLECKAFHLSKHLIDISFSCQSDAVTDTQLNDICKDRSTSTWKKDYQQIIKILRGSPLCREKTNKSPVLLCCESILELTRNLSVPRLKKTVNWTIIERLLLLYGSDCKDGTGHKSCLEKAEQCAALKELLSKQEDFDKKLNSTIWKKSFSGRYGSILTKVSTFREYKEFDQFRYHQDCIAEGSFGCEVFAGLNWKDGMEVAIKRIDKTKQSAARELENLVKLKDCKRVILYYRSFDEDNSTFLNMIFELMEGNLLEFVQNDRLKEHQTEENMDELCKQLLEGVHSIHENGIIHCQLIPDNILVKRCPKLSLKIAGFSQSCTVGSTSAGTFKLDAKSKCWFAPEVLRPEHQHHTKHSDMFSCGLSLRFIKTRKLPHQPIKPQDESPEMIHLLQSVLTGKENGRATAMQLLGHPFFWSKTKKMVFLKRISKEIKPKSAKKLFEDCICKTIVIKCDQWNTPISCTCFESRKPPEYRCRHDRKYMDDILKQIQKKDDRYTTYTTTKVTDLLRFIRNVDEHIDKLSKKNADLVRTHVFLDGFPNLVVEVFKAVISLKWDQTNQEIKDFMTL